MLGGGGFTRTELKAIQTVSHSRIRTALPHQRDRQLRLHDPPHAALADPTVTMHPTVSAVAADPV